MQTLVSADIVFPHIPISPNQDNEIYPSRSGTPNSLASSSSSASTSSFKFLPPPGPTPIFEYDPDAGYDDQVLEALYFRIFQERHINLKPTTQIPLYLNTYFNGNLILDRCRIPVPQCANVPMCYFKNGKGGACTCDN